MAKKFNLTDDEKLVYKVQKKKCLSDQAGLGYKERDCLTKAWTTFAKFLRTPFLQNTSGRLLLTLLISPILSLKKIFL